MSSFYLLYEAIKAKLIATGVVNTFGPPCCRPGCILGMYRSICTISLTRYSAHSGSPHPREGLSQWLQKSPTSFLQTNGDQPSRSEVGSAHSPSLSVRLVIYKGGRVCMCILWRWRCSLSHMGGVHRIMTSNASTVFCISLQGEQRSFPEAWS